MHDGHVRGLRGTNFEERRGHRDLRARVWEVHFYRSRVDQPTLERADRQRAAGGRGNPHGATGRIDIVEPACAAATLIPIGHVCGDRGIADRSYFRMISELSEHGNQNWALASRCVAPQNNV